MMNDEWVTRWLFIIPNSSFIIPAPVPHPTVTVNAQVALSPLWSMARHTTLVVPAGKLAPLPKPLSRKTDCTVQLSAAVGLA